MTRSATKTDLTLSQSLSIQIERDIVEGRLLPGDKLDEEVLAERLNASRTPVREALRALASVGLVRIQPRVGATVNKPTVSEVIELFEVVAEMEAAAARLACLRASDAEISMIIERHKFCEEQARTGTAESYFEANNQFHSVIWSAAGNHVLEDQIVLLNRRLSPYRRFVTFNPGRQQEAIVEHARIAEALRMRDEAAATAAMREHVSVLGSDVVQLARNLRL
ncbi:MAG: GntR family transcriptional regulator [Paracoccaceae bacterium]